MMSQEEINRLADALAPRVADMVARRLQGAAPISADAADEEGLQRASERAREAVAWTRQVGRERGDFHANYKAGNYKRAADAGVRWYDLHQIGQGRIGTAPSSAEELSLIVDACHRAQHSRTSEIERRLVRMLTVLDARGEAQRSHGQFERSLNVLQHTLPVAESCLGKEHEITQSLRRNLAKTRQAMRASE